MALIFADRVKQTTTTTGTGTINLDGSVVGFQDFVAAIGDGNTCYYCITDDTNWEVGLGTVTDDTIDTLSRDLILASSNSNSEVSWGSGEKSVFVTNAASYFSTLLVNPLTTNGDLIVQSGGSTTRLGIGSEGRVLTVVGGALAWADNVATNQNLFETIAGDTGSTIAISATDTLTITGGTGISTSVDLSSQTVTITNDSPNVDQNIWSNLIISGQDTLTPDTTGESLTFIAGTGISLTTDNSSKTLTITNTISDDQTAAEVTFTPSGSITSSDVQSAIEELDSDIQAITIPVDSVFGRTGAVVAEAGDYDASEITVTPFSDITATDVQTALEELKADIDAFVDTDNQTAEEVPFTPSGSISNSDVQSAIEELDNSTIKIGGNISDLINDAGYITAETDDQIAAEVPFTPSGSITSSDVQSAIEELDSDIQSLSADQITVTPFSDVTATDVQSALEELKIDIDAVSGSGGIDNIVEDTTPQLGGNLDINGFDIVSTSNSDITLAPNGSGIVEVISTAFNGHQPSSGAFFQTLTGYGDSGILNLRRANGTHGSHTVVLDTEEIGKISFGGADSTSTFEFGAAVIKGVATEDWDLTGQGSALKFYTTPNNTGAEVLRLTIDQNGALEVLTTDYENLVTTDDIIPNKKYVDDEIAAISLGSSDISFTPSGTITSSDVQSAIEELDSDIQAITIPVDSVFGRTGAVVAEAGDYDASEITVTPFSDITATDVQTALEELKADIDAFVDTDNQTAEEVPFTPTTGISSSNVQDAIGELESDVEATTIIANAALPRSGGEMTGNITMASTETVDGRDLSVDGSKLDNIEANADVTDAANVDAAGAVMEADYNANTILAATSDNTPVALTIPEQTLVGRITSGNIDALTATEVRTLINVEDGATADQTAADIRGLGFFDTSNDGTGSGLDADLLDGNHASAFLQNVVDDTSPSLGGNLDVNGFDIVSTSNGDIFITPDGSGNIVLDGLIWPSTDGTSGQVLTTDGSGNLSFTNQPLESNIQFVIDGGGSEITTGVKGYLELPFSGIITAVRLLADQEGSIVVDVWKDTYANYPPTDADTITASAVPTISTATKSEDTTLTGWTTTVSAGDILGFNVDSVTTITRVTVSLSVLRL